MSGTVDVEDRSAARDLLRAVREFVDHEVRPRVVQYNRDGALPADLVATVVKMGLVGGVIPEIYGGSGMDYQLWASCVEEFARYCTALAAIVGYPSSLAGQGLLRWGTEDQKNEFLRPLAAGECSAATAITEPDVGSDAASLRTVARRQGDHYVINGHKTWISNANTCRWMLLFANCEPASGRDGITAFLVDRETPGVETRPIKHKLASRVSDTGDVYLSDVVVANDRLLGEEGGGWSILRASVGAGRLHVAARSVGIAQGSLELSVEYAKSRQAFGQQIGRLQLVQRMLAEMAVQAQSARLMVREAASTWDQTLGGDAFATSMAKLHAAHTAMAVAHDAVQIHGAYGISDEYHVERLFREAKMQEIVDGTNEIQQLIIANRLMAGKIP